MRRLLATWLCGFALFAPSTAFAGDTTLSWERSQMQQVEIDTATAVSITSLSLMGKGNELTFSLSPQLTTTGRSLYQVLIPAAFELGDYVVHASLADGTFKDLAIINVVEYQSQGYNPLTDPNTVKTLSLTLFSLLAMWNISDSQLGRSSKFDGDQTTYEGIDSGVIGRQADDRRGYRRGLIGSIYLDQLRSSWSILSNRYSPLLSRFISDGGYLQFSLGVFSLAFPVLGAVLGAIAFKDIEGVGGITTPSFSIVATILVVAALDAGAGFLAAVVFGLCALTSHRFENIYDIRTYLGLAILWFAPAIIANATRPLRRSSKDQDWWERVTDIVVGSIITGWAVRCMVIALDGFAHLILPLHRHASTLGAIVGATIALRYVIETYVNSKNHYYLSYLSPKSLNEQNPHLRLLGWFVKSLLFIFFAVSFLGTTWQLWAAVALMMVPNIAKTIKERLPNSSALFQILPVGVPALVVMFGIGELYSNYLNTLKLNPSNASQTLFILAAIPAFAISLLKLFGRSPAAGDVRWYLRPQLTAVYRFGGVTLLAAYVAITLGLVG